MEYGNDNFLTEERLGEFLKEYMPSGEWVPQYKLQGSRFRVDWFSEPMKMCVEFDGYQHYTSAKQAVSDAKKDKLCRELGFTMIRIPYFVQLSNEVIELLFGKTVPYFEQVFPHGFISTKSTMVYPADFCWLGIIKFNEDIARFRPIAKDIIGSLKNKGVDTELILPEPLFRLLEQN